MKAVKYIISFLLVTLAFFFIGELYTLHIDEFTKDYSYVTFYPGEPGTKPGEMYKALLKSAEKNNLDIFTTTTEPSGNNRQVNIYATDGAKEELYKNSIRAGIYKSIIIGPSEIKIKKFSDLTDNDESELFYLIGDKEKMNEFKSSLIDKYGGSFPKEADKYTEGIVFAIGIWVIVLFLLFLLNLYAFILERKEITIKIILGQNIFSFIAKRVIENILVYAGLFLFAYFISSRFSPVFYLFNISLIAIIIFIIVNALLYFSLFFANYKRDLTTKKGAKSTLGVSYVYKIAVSVMLVLIIGNTANFILAGIDLYEQGDFFNTYKGYKNLSNFSTEEIKKEKYDGENRIKFYDELNSNNRVKSSVLMGEKEEPLQMLYVNSGLKSYLEENIGKLKTVDFIKDYAYCIIPKSEVKNKDEITVLSDMNFPEVKYKTIVYENNIKLVGIGHWDLIKHNSIMVKNPVIFFTPDKNFKLENDKSPEHGTAGFIAQSSMVNPTKAELIKYESEGTKIEMPSSLTWYKYRLESASRKMFLSLALLFIFFIIQFIIIRSVLKFEYQINAIEISLKKVLGYKLFSRYKKIFISSLITGFLGIAFSAILLKLMGDIANLPFIILGGFIAICFEFLTVLYYIRKLEKRNIQRILKGEGL